MIKKGFYYLLIGAIRVAIFFPFVKEETCKAGFDEFDRVVFNEIDPDNSKKARAADSFKAGVINTLLWPICVLADLIMYIVYLIFRFRRRAE